MSRRNRSGAYEPSRRDVLRLSWASLVGASTLNWLAAKADEVVKVTMDKKMLQFASKFMDSEGDDEGRKIIQKLNGIYVRSLEFKNEGEFTENDVAPVRAQLQGPEWSRIVQVESKSDKEHVEIFIKYVNNVAQGLVVLSEEPRELVLVHLDGPINPEDLDDLSGNFGIPKSVHGPKKATTAQPKLAPAVKK